MHEHHNLNILYFGVFYKCFIQISLQGPTVLNYFILFKNHINNNIALEQDP